MICRVCDELKKRKEKRAAATGRSVLALHFQMIIKIINANLFNYPE